jgi:hypothetical protein
MKPNDASRLTELEDLLRKKGALVDTECETILGEVLFRRLSSVGYFDRMEVNN